MDIKNRKIRQDQHDLHDYFKNNNKTTTPDNKLNHIC